MQENQEKFIELVKEKNIGKNLKYAILTMGCQLNENDSEKISGMVCTNEGEASATADEWYSHHHNNDYSGYDVAIIQLGVNDVIRYTTFGNTTKQAFEDIFSQVVYKHFLFLQLLLFFLFLKFHNESCYFSVSLINF